MTLTRLAFLAVAGLAANKYLKQNRNRSAATASDGARAFPSPASAAAKPDTPASAAAGATSDSPNAAERLPQQGVAAGLDDRDDALSAHAPMPGSPEFMRGA